MILDISQELFSCRVFPGDPAPKRERISSMEDGAAYNLTALSLCAHNGTHADAPFHFIREGKTVGELDPGIFLGPAFVYTCAGELTGERAEDLLGLAARCGAMTARLKPGAVSSGARPVIVWNIHWTIEP